VRILPQWSLPLLKKELVEQAVRKRTYAIRGVYAAALSVAFLMFFYSQYSSMSIENLEILGSGQFVFEFIVGLQFAGIFIFLPAMMCGALTLEKEHGSMAPLILTGMTPWQIINQKYLGRLVPMFSMLLLSLPLFAIAYAFGGISAGYLFGSAYLLLLACLEVGAASLMASAIASTTTTAFVLSYVLLLLCGMPIAIWEGSAGSDPFFVILIQTIPTIVFTAAFLGIARGCLLRNAFPRRRKSFLKAIFTQIDLVMNQANKYAWNVLLVRDRDTLPTDKPIEWRELTRKSLSKTRYLFRMLVAIELPILLITAFIFMESPFRRSMSEAVSALLFLLWPLAVLIISVNASGAFASERAGKTLDVLLVTPIPGREIIRQKMKPVWRLTLVLVIPFLTLFLVKAINEYGAGATWPTKGFSYKDPLAKAAEPMLYVMVSTAVVAIFLPMFSYVSLWIGLKARTRFRAILTTLTTIVVWCVLPILLVGVLTDFDMDRGSAGFLAVFSPLVIIPSIELDEFLVREEWVFVILTFLWHAGVFFYFRALCRFNADKYLGRVPYPFTGPRATIKPHLDM